MTKISFVQCIKRAGGRTDLYFRKGEHRSKLASAEGTEELRAEVEAHLARIARLDAAQTPKPGTVGGMLRQYSRSADFLSLSAKTQKEYQRMGDELEADIGDVLLEEVRKSWVVELRDTWATLGHRAASNRIQVLKNALLPAIEDERISDDPFSKIKKVKPPHDRGEPHPIWEDSEVEAVIALALKRRLPGLARAVALGRWAGFRRGTVCAIPLNARTQGYDDHGVPHRRLQWMTTKRKVLADKPEDARLTRLLAKTPDRALTIAYNDRNQSWKERSLNQALTRLLEALIKEGKMRPGLTFHGLRHSRGVELALAGSSDGEIMSQLEHATDRAAKIYRRQADRRRMADAAQARVDTVVHLRDTVVQKATSR